MAFCKFCGTNGLTWKQEQKGWRLFSPEGKKHFCSPFQTFLNDVAVELRLHFQAAKAKPRRDHLQKLLNKIEELRQ